MDDPLAFVLFEPDHRALVQLEAAREYRRWDAQGIPDDPDPAAARNRQGRSQLFGNGQPLVQRQACLISAFVRGHIDLFHQRLCIPMHWIVRYLCIQIHYLVI